ncbi:MAG: hypothetical protein AAFQ39_01795 [Pseudomonadota bacterium]
MTYKTRNIAAEDISDDLLYRTGLALVNGQFTGIEDCFVLPQMIETTEGARVLRKPDDVLQLFKGVRDFLEKSAVTDVVRTIVEAEYIAEDAIETIHVASLVQADGQPLRAPYPVYSLLKLCEDRKWRIAHTSYGIIDSRAHNEALLTWRSTDRD